MANTSLWEIQKSVVSTLTASTTVSNLVSSSIYDEPPTNESYPYLVVGNATEVPDNNLQCLGYNSTITVFIYTLPYGLGWYPAYEIYDAINNVLNYKRLQLDTLHCVMCKLDNVMQEKYNDKRILHCRYRFYTENKTTHVI
jgi:hypothetical protein